ncbi:tyrosine-protein phosphatase [Apilactobacillus quenuiae]|uniref:tyrosine-protein phosphatase n=1 Tax=Apilactobacillus quenuiae TaxID=2008377 RepID=UPI000D013184|nr:tyrosine-protein phosphatase [Apilactobacillus quenuiae]
MHRNFKKIFTFSATSLILFTSMATVITSNEKISVQASTQTGRQIKLKGTVNIRDLGGYQNTKGKTIKYKKLIRAAQLNTATKADLNKLKDNYNVGIDIDFRTPSEIAKANDPKINGIKYVKAPVVSDKENKADIKVFNKNGEKGMLLYYTYFINQNGRKNYRKLFNELLHAPKDKAVLYHCSYGKDRTGFATALILTALNFDKKKIYHDYLLSNKYRAKATNSDLTSMKKNGATKLAIKNEYYNDIVEKQYLDQAYKLAEQKYGSMMGYLKKGIGLSIHELKNYKLNI